MHEEIRMLSMESIDYAQTNWAFLIVSVMEKDGTLRICVIVGELNTPTIWDSHFMAYLCRYIDLIGNATTVCPGRSLQISASRDGRGGSK